MQNQGVTKLTESSSKEYMPKIQTLVEHMVKDGKHLVKTDLAKDRRNMKREPGYN